VVYSDIRIEKLELDWARLEIRR